MLFSILCIVVLSVFHVECLSMLRGQVVPKNPSFYGENLSGNQLHVLIEDISIQDVASTVLSERIIQLTGDDKFPLNFELVVPKALSNSGAFLNVAARIRNSANNQLLYITDTVFPLPQDTTNTVTLNLVKVTSNILDNRDVCQLQPESGRCMAYFPKYYFNSQTQQCEKFVYGGCGGNNNRFDTEEECLANCLPKVNINRDKVRICGLAKEVGPCKALIPRFHYDSASNQCKEFYYGGCRGNGNNFGSNEECIKFCMDV